MMPRAAVPPLVPIGVIRSPFREAAGTPIQPAFAADARGRVELFPEYTDGLRDIAGFERIWLLYLLDRSPGARLRVVPFLDDVAHGVFSTRAPCRPNPIGLSCVRVVAVEAAAVSVADVDILDGTPLLDIKPYVPAFDSFPGSRTGWLEKGTARRTVADRRFAGGRGGPPGGDERSG